MLKKTIPVLFMSQNFLKDTHITRDIMYMRVIFMVKYVIKRHLNKKETNACLFSTQTAHTQSLVFYYLLCGS